MDRRWKLALAAVIAAGMCVVMVSGCGAEAAQSDSTSSNASSVSPRILTTKQAKLRLQKLPYQYAFRSVPLPNGAEGALAGKVTGPHHTSFQFGIALGSDTEAVPVPEVGTDNPTYVPGAGFVFSSNVLIEGPSGKWILNPKFKTEAQADASARISVGMEEALCRAATGAPCPV